MSGYSGGVPQQASYELVLQTHNQRIKGLEDSDGSGPWIPVDDAGGNPLSPGYELPWEDAPGDPLEFKRFLNWLHLRGGFQGGTDGSVVFTLPEQFRPGVVTHMLLPLSDGAGFGSVVIATNGEVTYLGAFVGAPGTGAVVEVTSIDGSLTVSNATGPIVDLSVDVAALDVVTSIDGGGGQLTGDVTFTAGTNVTLNQVGNDIEINASGSGGGGVDSLDGGGGPLTGDVTLSAGPGISLAQVGQDIEIDNDGVLSLTVGTEVLTGDVTLLAGSGITLTVLGDTVEIAATGGGGSGIQFETEPQLGDWLDVETSAVDGDGFGMSFKNAQGMRISGPDPDVLALIVKSDQTGSGNAQGVSIDMDSVDGQAFALLVDAAAAGDGDALGMDLTARTAGVGQASGIIFAAYADGAGNAIGLSLIGAALGAGSVANGTGAEIGGQSVDGPALGARVFADATGTGNVTGLQVQCGAGAGGTITTVLILDDGGNPIFEIRNDGTVHILTGTAILADL